MQTSVRRRGSRHRRFRGTPSPPARPRAPPGAHAAASPERCIEQAYRPDSSYIMPQYESEEKRLQRGAVPRPGRRERAEPNSPRCLVPALTRMTLLMPLTHVSSVRVQRRGGTWTRPTKHEFRGGSGVAQTAACRTKALHPPQRCHQSPQRHLPSLHSPEEQAGLFLVYPQPTMTVKVIAAVCITPVATAVLWHAHFACNALPFSLSGVENAGIAGLCGFLCM